MRNTHPSTHGWLLTCPALSGLDATDCFCGLGLSVGSGGGAGKGGQGLRAAHFTFSLLQPWPTQQMLTDIGPRLALSYPQLAIIVIGPQELHDVWVVTGGQDLNLHDVVLQLLLALSLNDFGCCQGTGLLVFGLQR